MEIPEYQVGDVNKDGSVNIADLVDLKRFILNMDKKIDAELADINTDGKINIFDCVQLKKILLDM